MKYRQPEARGKSSPSRVKIGTLLLCLTGFSSAKVSGADQTIHYPDSISAVASGESQSGGHSAVQTFSYPDKAKPDFAVDFPADWNMKATDEGVYVESHDKLVAMNVIMVDKADLLDAEETLKKKVGERFKEILWNGGADPEVNKDAALGLTATFQHAQASDGTGTEKYSVNLVTYERKSGNKVLILLCQNPMRALEKHADAMETVLKSIKVR